MGKKPAIKSSAGRTGLFFFLALVWLAVFYLRFISFDGRFSVFLRAGSILSAITLFAAVSLCAFGAGSLIFPRKRGLFHSNLEKFAASTAAGYGAISLLVFLMGAAGLLSPGPALGLLACLLMVSLGPALRFARNAARHRAGEGGMDGFEAFLPAFFALSALIYLIPVFAPPLNYDTLAYHLAVPRRFIEAGRIHYIPGNVYSNFPMNMEFLFILGMLLRDDSLARLFHFGAGLLCAVSIYSFSAKHFDRRTALVASVSFYSIPYTGLLSGWAFNELLLTLYTFLSVAYFAEWYMTKKPGHLGLSSVFCALAIGTKYTALLFLLPFILAGVIIKTLKDGEGRGKVLAGAGTVLAVCLLVPLPWFIKNAVYTFNPVYPFAYGFFNSLFGHPLGETFNAAAFMEQHSPRAASLPAVITLLSNTAMDRLIGPFFALCLPLLLLVKPLKTPDRIMLLYFASCLALWTFSTHQDPRFLLPALSCLAVPAAHAVSNARKRGRTLGNLACAMVIAALLANFPWVPLHIAQQDFLKVFFALQSRHEYLMDSPLYQYPAFSFINSELEEDARILFVGENQTYYCRRQTVSNSPLDRNPLVEITNRSSTVPDIRNELKEMGITHILYNSSEVKRTAEFYGSFYFLDAGKHALFLEFFSSEQYLDLLFGEKGVFIWKLN